ncbi:MAG: MarR family transcriptional regulator [bacterium]
MDRSARTARAVAPTRPAIVESIEAIRRIMRGLRVAAQETRSAVGISAAQHFVLSALHEHDDQASVSELAERTMTDRSSVAAVVDRLVEDGLVTRGTAKDDRRRAAIALTARGRAVLRRSPEPPTARLIAALEALPPTRLRELSGALTALVSAMGLHHARAGLLFEDTPVRKRPPRAPKRT